MIKILELFGGISAPYKALLNLGIEVETVDYVEFDKNITIIRNGIYNSNYQPKSVTDFVWDGTEIDLIIGGSPCQDYSKAGKQKGGVEGSGTRSALIWEQVRIVGEVKPKYYIWENVKNLLSKTLIEDFYEHNKRIEDFGYKLQYAVLNAKDFGIPQNRERVFVVAIRNDIQNEFDFKNVIKKEMFPLKEFLITNKESSLFNNENILLDEWYYVKTKQDWVKKRLKGGGLEPLKSQAGAIKVLDPNTPETTTSTIITEQWKGNNSGVVLTDLKDPYFFSRKVNVKDYDNTITAEQSHFTQRANENKILEPITETKEYTNFFIIPSAKNVQQDELLVIKWKEKLWNVRILHELECFRLMGFTDKDFNNASNEIIKNNIKSTRKWLYYVAGNSIVVNVLEAIFKELFKGENK